MKRKFFPFSILILIVASLCLGACLPIDYDEVSVRRIIDGDTIELNNGERVRYLGIDTPETRKKVGESWVEVSEPFGQEAKKLNAQLVAGKKVRLEFDIERKDKYGRLLAYCFVEKDGSEVMVQIELLRQGLAYLYTWTPNIKYVDTFVQTHQEAKDKKLGLWSLSLDIDSSDADQHLDTKKLVYGIIEKVKPTAHTIKLQMPGLNLVVFRRDLILFEREDIDLNTFYLNKRVRAQGKIKEYKGKPEMVISGPWQIEIIK